MNHHLRRGMAGFTIAALLAACTSATAGSPDPSGPDGPSSSGGVVSAASPGGALPSASTPVATGPLGGGRILVWQLDGLSSDHATTESIFTLDAGSGARTPIGTLPSDENTCCPAEVTFAADRTIAVLSTGRFWAAVDVVKGTISTPPLSIPQFVVVSQRGDRVAWVDTVTGTAETVVIADSTGHVVNRLDLPAGAWQTNVSWSPDGTKLLATTELPIAAGEITLARALMCCSVDHGVTATHLLVIPVDGSPIRDLANDADEIAADLAAPASTPPPGVKPRFAQPQSSYLQASGWSPDSRKVAFVEGHCPPSWTPMSVRVACPGNLVLIDAQSGARTVVTDVPSSLNDMSWSSAGDRLAYIVSSSAAEPSGLFVVDLLGGRPVRLTDAETQVDWSPDGSWLVFGRLSKERTDGDRVGEWVIPASGGSPRLIADHAAAGW